MTDTTADPTPLQTRPWPTALVAALVVSGALLLGGAGGFALASALHSGDRPGIHVVSFPGAGPGSGPGPHVGGPGQPGGQQQGGPLDGRQN